MIGAVWLLLIVGASFALAGPNAAQNLLLEYLPSPVLGLDIPLPRFSWQLSHTDRGQAQTAFSIEVVNILTNNVVWNSLVRTAQTSQIVYAGQQLQSDTSYYWNVTWWDSNGVQSPSSNLAYFDTGLFNESEWQGTWIGGGNQVRTTFDFPREKQVVRARLFITGMGYYAAFINGERVGDHVLGPWTQYESRSLYDVYAVEDLLSHGGNAIAVYLGKGFYGTPSVRMGPVALISQLSVTFDDGSHEYYAVSGNTWKVINGSIVFDDVYIGEHYDARLDTIGWELRSYDDSAWMNATYPSPAPPGKLQAYLAYPQRIVQVFSPVNMWECNPGTFVFDFGQNMAGYTRIGAMGPAGTMITIQHSEMVNVATNCLESLYSNAPMIDNFTLAGTGEYEYFEPTFVFHGFQYAQVTGYPGVPNSEDIEAFFIHSDLPNSGSFVTSDDTLNYVDFMGRISAISNFQSIPSDCPTREKRGWLGDAQVSCETQIHYWDMSAAYTKFVQDIHDSQTKINKSGTVGDTAPWYDWGAAPADPAWGAAFTLIWYWSYVYYNDTRMLETHYDGVKWYISSLQEEADADTSLLAWSRYGDWCAVADPSFGCAYNSSVVSSFYYILQLNIFAEVATILGNSADAATYNGLYLAALKEFNVYLHPNNYTYDLGFQTYQVLPLVLGAVPSEAYDNVVNYLLNDVVNTHNNHLTVGIVGAKYLLSTLAQLGRADLAWAVTTQVDQPSWYWFAAQGGTSYWENWQSTREAAYGSRNHIMFGGQSTWYYQGIAGITMTPGTIAYSDITIAPQLLSDDNLTFASASLATHKGQILSSWAKGEGLCVAVAETQNATLSCASGVIEEIIFASFGTPSGTCGNFVINPACNANDTMAIVSKLCLGKSSCVVPAQDFIFQDPCHNVFKRLYIQASGCNLPQFSQQANIPVGSQANIVVNLLALSNVSIFESNVPVWQNNQFVPNKGNGVTGASSSGGSVTFRVGSGNFNFQLYGNPGQPVCMSAAEGETFKFACPTGHQIGRVKFASFGTATPGECGSYSLAKGMCSIGATKHMVEKHCLYQNKCSFPVTSGLFGDPNHRICGSGPHVLHAELICSQP